MNGVLLCDSYQCEVKGDGFVTISADNPSQEFDIELTTNFDFTRCEVVIVPS